MKKNEFIEINVQSHKRIKFIAKNILFIFFILLLGALLLPWQQTAFGTGNVVALYPNEREQKISAPINGRLEKWHVEDGSYVKKGQIIIAMSDIDPNIIYRLKAERKAVLTKVELAEQAAKTALIDIERQEKLYNEGISSRKKYEQANFKYLQYKNDIAKSKVELAKLNVRIARQNSQEVFAPMDGTILLRLAGERSVIVKQGDPIATLIPDTEKPAVELWLDGNDIPLVHVNDIVRLQFEGWPALQFSGWPSVAIGTFGGKVIFVNPKDDGNGRFRILVTPENSKDWPSVKYLRQGIRVKGWVMLKEVPLWFELWRRFNGFPPAIERIPKGNSVDRVAL